MGSHVNAEKLRPILKYIQLYCWTMAPNPDVRKFALDDLNQVGVEFPQQLLSGDYTVDRGSLKDCPVLLPWFRLQKCVPWPSWNRGSSQICASFNDEHDIEFQVTIRRGFLDFDAFICTSSVLESRTEEYALNCHFPSEIGLQIYSNYI